MTSPLERVPWLAITSLLLVIICMGASASIIVVSNNQTVSSWNVQPSVLLAYITSVSNLALSTAFSIAVAIMWWLSAVEGASLSDLHHIWNRGQGTSFVTAFVAGGNTRKVVLAMALVTVTQLVNNTLLQRATRQKVEVEIVTQEHMKLSTARQLPEGWFGKIMPDHTTTGSLTGLATARTWWQNDTTDTLPGYYCAGTCTGNVPGAGISYNCTSTTQPLNLSAATNATIFAINFTMSTNSTGAPFILLTTIHASDVNDSCIATLTTDTCKIEAGTVEYPVVIQNSTVELNFDELNDVHVLSKYISPGDLPTVTLPTPAGTLEGLNHFIGSYLTTDSEVRDRSTWSAGSTLADMFYLSNSSSYSPYTARTCQMKWSSPTRYVLSSMHSFMFHAALLASNAQGQEFTVGRSYVTEVFQSDYRYLAAALLIRSLAVVVVLCLLWGWQTLERRVSLSPIETAKAFCAPLMAAHNIYTTDEILKRLGDNRLGYRDGKIVNLNVTTQQDQCNEKDNIPMDPEEHA